MEAAYGSGASSPAAVSDFSGDQACFLVARLDGVDVGCGGLRVLRPGVGELKRMYVVPDVRGRGVARALLAALLDRARATGLVTLLLETGTEQPAAIALYLSVGFTPVTPYGHYREDPRSRCFALDLAPA